MANKLITRTLTEEQWNIICSCLESELNETMDWEIINRLPQKDMKIIKELLELLSW